MGSRELPRTRPAKLLADANSRSKRARLPCGCRPRWPRGAGTRGSECWRATACEVGFVSEAEESATTHLLDDIEAETDEQREVRLREELAEHLRAHAGSRPSWTSPLYIKLQKAGLLGLLQAASGPMKQAPVRSTSLTSWLMCYLEEILASGMMFASWMLAFIAI